MSGSRVWNHGASAAVDLPPVCSASSLFSLIISSVTTHYCYDVEAHKRKQPCTEPADSQHTYTI
ncbi:hypothetical protein T4D_15266 [Trichinella pseudospiralis]|uniref:Uncharacterized protein n=1 Tax=Trichinella pseudospiralis TaxID=6337 RepID=A0A0V1FJZ6_TRIPS|nr:hypothetical protein T4D_15266 [Trichinella pseudospiralis]